MKTNWRAHYAICTVLVLLVIPVSIWEHAQPRGGPGGNWITLERRGLAVGLYIIYLVAQIIVASVAVGLLPRVNVFIVHAGVALARMALR